MSDNNLNSSINSIKSNLLADIPTATVTELVNIARSLKGLNLWNDSAIETAVNDRAITLLSGATADEIIKISAAIKSMMGPTPSDVSVDDLSTLSTSLIPDTDITYDLGSASNKFRSLYMSGNTINLGDQSISSGDDGIEMSQIKIGTGINSVLLSAGMDGNLVKSGTNSAGQSIAIDYGADNTTLSVTSVSELINITNPPAGQNVLVTSTRQLFVYTGTAWYVIATMDNESPTPITGANNTYSLPVGSTPTVLTLVSADPEGFALTWSYAVTSGALNGTTVGQADNVFTITPSDTDIADFSLTFSATDGEGVATYESSFTITNIAPVTITGVNSTYNFTGGDAAFTITAISSDPEGFPLTWSHTVSSGALNGTTVTAVDNVFTITPHSENAATFGLTISVTDGVGVATFESAFTASSPMPSVDILVVGGGGGGGARGGAGGGGGEYKIYTGILQPNTSYPVSVGAGGEDPSSWQYGGGAGTQSVFGSGTFLIRSGGGGGGGTTNLLGYYNGGGSTGGGSRDVNTSTVPTNIYNTSSDFGTGYRTRGGSGSGDHGGGAGGAGQAGGNANGNASGGHGGDGKIWLDGNYYAGGGSGGADYQQYNSNTPGGLGGGGAGREYYVPNGDHGTGGGGGGGFNPTHSVFVSSDHGHDGYQTGTFGGNGVIIVRVPETAAQPTVTGTYVTTTTTGGYTYYKWAQLGAYGGAGGPTSQVHDALSLSFEANRATTTGTIIWNT